jgi:uncharacterized membrane protein YoaK (UPF0700 family)
MSQQAGTARAPARQVYRTVALLCSIAGAVDALAYLSLGKLFVANLTGNTVLFAYHAAERHWAASAERLALIFAFLIGVITNRLLKRWIQSEKRRLNPAVVSLTIECSVLCTLALFSTQGYLRVALLLALAWTMGLQNDAFQHIGPVNLNTTFLTGDIEKLGGMLADSATESEKHRQHRQRIVAFATAWLAYAGGALLGALGSHLFQLRALLLPAAMVLIVLTMELSHKRIAPHRKSENLLPER